MDNSTLNDIFALAEDVLGVCRADIIGPRILRDYADARMAIVRALAVYGGLSHAEAAAAINRSRTNTYSLLLRWECLPYFDAASRVKLRTFDERAKKLF